MKNLVGDNECDKTIRRELEAAHIAVVAHKGKGEVQYTIKGILGTWEFHRAWYYYIAHGDHIPYEIADELHARHGKAVRVAGHAGCPSPREWHERPNAQYPGKIPGVPSYHVDTQEGLIALVKAISKSEGLTSAEKALAEEATQ